MNTYACIMVVLSVVLCAAPGVAREGPAAILGIITGPDGARLPGAMVSARLAGSEESVRAVSNASGMYRLPGLPTGDYELLAVLSGFEPYALSSLSLAAGVNRVVDVTMRVGTISEIITVTGFSPRDSVEGARTRESSARDVGEAVAEATGIHKLRKGGIASDVVLRGFQSKDLNILIDGQRVYGACPNHMDPAPFHVDFAEVDRIEVAKGPFDVNNQGSLGGVVNIVTKKAEAGLHATGTLSTGSYGYVNPSATLSFSRAPFSILGGYSYRRSDAYTDGSGTRFTEGLNYRPESLDSDAFRVGTIWGNVSFSPFAGHLAQFSYSHQEADHVLYPYLQMDAVYDDTGRLNAGYQVTGLPGFVRSVRIQAYFSRVDHWMTDEYRSSSLNRPREYSMGTMAGTQALGGKIEAELGSVKAGIEAYHREWNASTGLAGAGYAPQYSIPDVRTDSFGLYSEYSRSLSDRVRLSFGGRLDTVTTAADDARANGDLYYAYHSTRLTSKTNNYPSGNVRLSVKAPLGLQFSGGIGHTVRVPDARERYFALKRMGTDWVGNPGLEPSRNTGLDGGVSFRHEGLLLESSLYFNRIGDFVTVIPQAKVNMVAGVMNGNARTYLNADARIYGGEVLVSYLLSTRLFLSSDLSFVRGTRALDPERGILTPNLAEIPPVRSRTTMRYDTGRTFVEVEALFSGAQRNVDALLGEQPTPGYGIANLKGGLNYRGASLRLGLNNLFGRQYVDYLSYQRDPFRSGARVYEPGRNWFLSLSVRF